MRACVCRCVCLCVGTYSRIIPLRVHLARVYDSQVFLDFNSFASIRASCSCPLMDFSSVRQVCLLAFREEARDHQLLTGAWHAWITSRAQSSVEQFVVAGGGSLRDRAECVVCKFVAAHSGTVTTNQLSDLYMECPWLKRAVGSLKEFCEVSERLV